MSTTTIIAGTCFSTIACNNSTSGVSDSNQAIANKIDNQKINFTDNHFWGILNQSNKTAILNSVAKAAKLNSSETKLLEVDPDLLKLDTIDNGQSAETQSVYIFVGQGASQAAATIQLTWKLTADQVLIYPVYLNWQKYCQNHSEINQNGITFDGPESFDPTSPQASPQGWLPNHYSTLSLNQNPFKAIVDQWFQPRINVSASNLVLPNIEFKVGQVQSVSNILVKNLSSSFPLLYRLPYSGKATITVGKPLKLSYITDYNFVQVMLKKISPVGLATSQMVKNKDGNYYADENEVSIIGSIKGDLPQYSQFANFLRFPHTQLKLYPHINNVEVLYSLRKVDQNLTIPVSVLDF